MVGKSKEELEQDLSILEEVLRMLLEILNAAFTHQLASNQHLIYSVLHKREVLDVLRRQPAFQDIVTNIDTVLIRCEFTFKDSVFICALFRSRIISVA